MVLCCVNRISPPGRFILPTQSQAPSISVNHASSASTSIRNTSPFTPRDLRSRGSQQQLRQDFEAYLNGFSPNVQDILENFKFRNQITTLSKADALSVLIEKFLDPDINLSPNPVLNNDGSVKLPAMESLRFASGDEEIRSQLHEEFGDPLFDNFSSVEKELAKRLADWVGGDDEGDDEDSPRKGLSEKKKKKLLDAGTWARDARLVNTATALREQLGGDLFEDHNRFRDVVDNALKDLKCRGVSRYALSAAELKLILKAVSWRVETAPPVIAKVYKPGKIAPDPLKGLYAVTIGGKKSVVEYKPDTDLRDTEQAPLLEEGGIKAFFRREVLPYTPDAWLDESKTKIGYEISFTRHFYKPQPLRTLEEIRADIKAAEQEAEGLLDDLLEG